MKLTVYPVEINHIQNYWPLVEGYVKEALDKGMPYPEWSHSYNADHVRAYLAGGEWILLIAVDEEKQVHGAMTISFINYPLHRVAFITTTGGKFITNEDTLNQLKQLAKYYGATKLQSYCRDSMVRYLKRYGFEPRNTLVETLV